MSVSHPCASLSWLPNRHMYLDIAPSQFQGATFLSHVVWLGRPSTESTWKSAETLHQHLTEEFKAGILRVVSINRDTSQNGGQTVHTICTKRSQSSAVQLKAKNSRWPDESSH